MSKFIGWTTMMVVCLLLLSSSSEAHKPSYSENGTFSKVGTPYRITDVDLSIVVYHKADCNSLQMWMSFSIDKPRTIFMQLGVPKIIRLLEYRPKIAVLMPGLPQPTTKLPFALPEGYGAIVYDKSDLKRPSKFHEPFTNTTSLLLLEENVPLPKAGKGYIVAWHPKQTGKYWVAVGEREEFGPEDFKLYNDVWFDKTQAFHEVGDYETNNPPKEQVCEETKPGPVVEKKQETPQPPPAQTKEAQQPQGMGCNSLQQDQRSEPWSLILLAMIAIVGLLRKRNTDSHII